MTRNKMRKIKLHWNLTTYLLLKRRWKKQKENFKSCWIRFGFAPSFLSCSCFDVLWLCCCGRADPCAICVCMVRIHGCWCVIGSDSWLLVCYWFGFMAVGVLLVEISLCVHGVHHFLEFFCGLILENVERM